MRITKISVRKLFGVFDHEIPLNQDSRITVIHGPNGVGKTVLLRMVHGLFCSNYGIFTEVPFDRFGVHFDIGQSLYVDQDRPVRQLALGDLGDEALRSMGGRLHASCSISHSHEPGTDIHPYIPSRSREKYMRFIDLVESIPELDRIGNNVWFSEDFGSSMTMDEIITAYNLDSHYFANSEPEWLVHIKNSIDTQCIETQRLQSSTENGQASHYRSTSRRFAQRSTVERYSDEIAKTIQSTLTEYGQSSQRIDSSFPTRLLDTSLSSSLDNESLLLKLGELEEKSTELMKLGIFEAKDAPTIPTLDSSQENLTNVLSIYVEDVEDKLAVLDKLAEQLRVLTDIINTRFEHKTLKVDRQNGFVITARDEHPIPLQSLSSGEQHELVLFYQLLFDAKPNSLIMIDEPEISLHVNWQEQFLNDIQRVSDLRQFDVLIATHSPDIISDKHEWMVELGEAVHA